jgi:hypothetical protein
MPHFTSVLLPLASFFDRLGLVLAYLTMLVCDGAAPKSFRGTMAVVAIIIGVALGVAALQSASGR